MKTIKLNLIKVGVSLIIITAIGFSGLAYGNPDAPAKKTTGLRQERVAINQDLDAINQQQAEVKALKKQMRDEKAAGIKSATTCSDLAKAKADVKHQKAYLKADKRELLMAHQQIIDKREKAAMAQRQELRELQKKLDADLADGKASAVLHAQAIVDAKHELKQKEAALESARLNRDSDLQLVNREMRDMNGESAFVLSVEEKNAKTQLAYKK